MTPLETEANPNIRVGPLRWGRPRGTGPVPLLAKQVRFGFCVLPVRRCLVAVYENAADLPVLIQPQKIGPGPRA